MTRHPETATFIARGIDIAIMPVLTPGKTVDLLLDVVEGSSQPFIMADSSGRIAGCNSAFCRLLGYTKEELMSRHVSDLTPEEWRRQESDIIAGQVRSRMPAIYNKEYLCKNGSRVSVELYDHVIFDKAGQPLYFYAFVSDMTGRKER